VKEIELCLAKAKAANERLRTNVKESKTRVAALEAALQARLDVERQETLEIKAAKKDKRKLKKRLVRAQDKAAQGTTPKLRSCSVTEFNKKTPEARRKASQRDRDMWSEVLNGDQRLDGLVSALESQGRLDELFNVKELYEMHIGKVNDIMRRIEEEHYGVDFGLFLHYEMALPLHKILRITHAGSHEYHKEHDHYMRKAILCSGNGSTGQYSVKVPRLGPPRNVLEPVMRELEDSLGVETREDGRVAFLEFDKALADIVNEDPGRGGMPPLEEFEGGKRRFPVVFSFDATGFGNSQLTTVALRNPYKRASAAQLRLLGIGSLSDSREGALKVISETNLEQIRAAIRHDQNGTTMPVKLQNGTTVHICPALHVTLDTGALRKWENRVGSGWCSCCRDDALRKTPSRPGTVKEMLDLCRECHAPDPLEQYALAHEPLPGEPLPRPCPCCNFCHDESTAMREYEEEKAKREELRADDSKAGRAKYARWQCERAKKHLNIKAGPEGLSVLGQATHRSHLCHLHVARLNLPKTPWQWGLLNHMSDDGRELVQTKLKEYGFPLDLRDNKFFSGGAWDGFCNGDKKSPGGPKAIAEFLLIMLDDLKTRGVEVDGDEVDAAPIAAPAPAPAQTSASGRNARIATSAMAAPAASSSVERDQDELSYTESFVERQFFADHAGATDSLKAKYGNWANTAIRTALAFDAYFSWYYAWRNKVPLDAPQEDKETRALENMQLAVDMHEMFERVSLSRHGSFMPHAAIYKITQSILEVGDVEAFDTSPLEMQNAETKRKARSTGATNRTTIPEGVSQRGPRKKEGPPGLHTVAARAATTATTTLKKLVTSTNLQRGKPGAPAAIPAERRTEKTFGSTGTGRSKPERSGVKLQQTSQEIRPRDDSVLLALTRMIKKPGQ